MGKLVTFWSPFIGQAKVTSSMCAIVTAFAMQYPELELALSHTQPETMELEERLDCRVGFAGKKELYEKTGVSALLLQYMQGGLTSERIRRCAIPLFIKSMYLFSGIGKKEPLDPIQYNILTEKIVKEFDITFLDLASGEKEASFQFMKVADAVVVVLPQKPSCWELFFKQWMKKLEGREIYIIIGGYFGNSKYNETYFKRRRDYRVKGKWIGIVPMNIGFMDAMIEGRTLEFFLKNELIGKKEKNYEFMEQTKQAAEQLNKYLKGEKGKNLFVF